MSPVDVRCGLEESVDDFSLKTRQVTVSDESYCYIITQFFVPELEDK